VTDFSLSDPTGIALIFIGLFLGAVLKGATGAGLPIIAIPAIAAVYDVRVAVVLLVIPNFITNIWQIREFKQYDLPSNFAKKFALAGFFGAGTGTLLLAYLPLVLLQILITLVLLGYIALRLLRPTFQLAMNVMQKWVFIAGGSAGVLQGAIGLSSPITITFLHSGRFPRPTFIYIVSLFFAMMSVMQLPLQFALGLMNWTLALVSLISLLPIMIGLPLGQQIGKRLNAIVFDRTILVLLIILAIKTVYDVFQQLT